MEHQKQYQFFKQKLEAGQLAHAYLLAGNSEANLLEFAKRIAILVSGGQGQQVSLIEKEQYPDMLVVRSSQSESSLKNEKDMLEIDVDQIRKVNSFLSLTPYYGGYKTVIIENAERLNTEAQSCLLKTLEEPKGKTLILLLSERPEMMLSTIFSRCQVIKCNSARLHEVSPAEKKIIGDLEKLIAGDLATKFLYAKGIDFDQQNLEGLLLVWQRYFREALLGHFEVGTFGRKNVPPEKLQHILQTIGDLQKQVSRFNVNSKLALETLLLEI